MPPFLPRSNTMNNFTEDLTGLSRADLVYKAKLAEQAERCVRGPPACPYHFRQKLQKASPSRRTLCAIGAEGFGAPRRRSPIPDPTRRSNARNTPRMLQMTRFFGHHPVATWATPRDPGPDLAPLTYIRPLFREAEACLGGPHREVRWGAAPVLTSWMPRGGRDPAWIRPPG